jgi:uncharacterized protein
MQLEWDERKRRTNLAKHRLDFRRAVDAFQPPNFTYSSPRSEEARWVTVGASHGRLVAVVWTERQGAVRIISMRRARREEARQYRQLLG